MSQPCKCQKLSSYICIMPLLEETEPRRGCRGELSLVSDLFTPSPVPRLTHKLQPMPVKHDQPSAGQWMAEAYQKCRLR